jgi:putative DNA primase/helicase
MMRTPTTVTGAAVRLDLPTDTLAVTEGIETGLAVRLSAGVPVWAALSAGNMAAIILPETVRLVIICADHDAGGTGQHAAKALARRLLREGRRVKMFLPSIPGTDWADGLQGGLHV